MVRFCYSKRGFVHEDIPLNEQDKAALMLTQYQELTSWELEKAEALMRKTM